MKVMILAAGRGERLRPLTDHTPKPLIKAGTKRLIEYLIESLVHSDLTDLIINYAHLGEQFPDALQDGSQYGAKIQFSPELQGGLETAGGIINALPLIDSDPFLVVNGDIWTDFDFSVLKNLTMPANNLCHLVMVDNPVHNAEGDFAITEHGDITSNGYQKYTFSGIALYRKALFEGLDNRKRALKPLFEKAISAGQASGQLYHGKWSDIGTVERLKQLEDEWLQP